MNIMSASMCDGRTAQDHGDARNATTLCQCSSMNVDNVTLWPVAVVDVIGCET